MLYKHVQGTWVKALAQLLSDTDSVVEIRDKRVVKPQRNTYQILMRIVISKDLNLKLVHQCRLCMQVKTVEDIKKDSGTMIEPWTKFNKGLPIKLRWPRKEKLSKRAWKEWKKIFNQLLLTYSHGNRLLKPNYHLG